MNEALWFLLMVLNFLSILFAYRFFGRTGLYIWIPISAIIANIQVVKEVELFTFAATLGNIVYATSFLVTDILSENYGKKEARKAVYIGFFSLIIMTVFMNLAIVFEPGQSDWADEHIKAIFSILPRIALGSLTAYAISQLHDVWAYSFWKKKKPAARFIWLRNNASTWISQLIDSLVFVAIAFAGTFEFTVLLEIFATTYILKVIVAALDTPFLYIAAHWKRTGKITD